MARIASMQVFPYFVFGELALQDVGYTLSIKLHIFLLAP